MVVVEKIFSDRENEGYKGIRGSLHSAVADGVNLAINLMVNAKMSLYRIEHMEADDIIYSMVQDKICRQRHTNRHNPNDIVFTPLVDAISVYKGKQCV